MNQRSLRGSVARTLMLALAVATATVGAVVAATSAPAQAASSIGGQITRSEVMARATNWYIRRYDSDLTYSMTSFTWDGTHSRMYRRDCSGFIDMAWHLGSDPNTQLLDDSTYTYAISRSELKPGDLLDDTIDSESGYPYHAILFGGWEDSAKTRFWYYSFGSTPLVKVTGASFSNAYLSGHPTSEYKARRYWKIVDDADDEDPRTADVTGDGFADLVARRSDGSLWLYSNNIVRDDGVPYSSSASRQIGSGWSSSDRIINADATGDGFADLLLAKSDGSLWLYPNNIVRDDGVPYSSATARQIGNGWNTFDRIIGADVTGDGFTDLVARKPDGSLWLYSNNFVRDDGVPYSSSASRQIGNGWNIFDRIVGADVTGDGFADLVARKSDGSLWLYSNNFVRDDGVPYSDNRQIGSGWTVFDQIV